MRALRGRSLNSLPMLIANNGILDRQCVRKRGYNIGNFVDAFLRKESAARLRLHEFPFLFVSSSAESFPGSTSLCIDPSITRMWGTVLSNGHQTRVFNEVFPLFCIANVQAACGH